MSWVAEPSGLVELIASVEIVEVVKVAAILALGATIQTAVGFGMGLSVVSLLVWVGYPLPHAVAMLFGGAALQASYGAYLSREIIMWRHSLSFACIQWIGVVAGVMCMALLVQAPPALIKQGVGMVVLVLLVIQLLIRPEPRAHIHAGWKVLAGFGAGFTGGLAGVGGPPIVLYALAHDWDRDQFRAFLWTQFLLGVPVLVTVMTLRFGVEILQWFCAGLATLPVIFLGTRLGLFVTRKWSRDRLRIVALVLLFVIAGASIAAPYL